MTTATIVTYVCEQLCQALLSLSVAQFGIDIRIWAQAIAADLANTALKYDLDSIFILCEWGAAVSFV